MVHRTNAEAIASSILPESLFGDWVGGTGVTGAMGDPVTTRSHEIQGNGVVEGALADPEVISINGPTAGRVPFCYASKIVTVDGNGKWVNDPHHANRRQRDKEAKFGVVDTFGQFPRRNFADTRKRKREFAERAHDRTLKCWHCDETGHPPYLCPHIGYH